MLSGIRLGGIVGEHAFGLDSNVAQAEIATGP
jgi:hypothetical protein